jgi:methyl-accepting chemotaxis protein
MEAGQEGAKAGLEQATQAGNALDTITQSVSTISDMNIQIASAAEEQSAVAEEINRNISSMSESLDNIAHGSQQTASAGEALAQLGNKLQQQVSQFKVE